MEIVAISPSRADNSACGDDSPPIMSFSCSTSTSSCSTLPQEKLYKTPQSSPRTSRIQGFLRRVTSYKVLDNVTNVAGSRLVFLSTLALLLLWTILGIVLGATPVWQIVMQNASSIQCYISDTLLMRQQANSTKSFLVSIAEMRSRSASCHRMLQSLTPSQLQELMDSKSNPGKEIGIVARDQSRQKGKKINLFERVCDWVALATGSLPALLIYTLGTFVWLGFGPLYAWGNIWQLYINTAVAVELTFTSMFLQNVRRRHAHTLSLSLSSIQTLDCDLEVRLREMTGDMVPNPKIVVTPPESSRIERCIDVYAYVVGSGVGVALTTVVVVVWLSLGHLLAWNSNWWLIIGTYTGLVGFVDGFVLRNVYFRQSAILETHLQELISSDREVYSVLGLGFASGDEDEEGGGKGKRSLGLRISECMIYICALPSAVMGSLAVVVVLLAVATGLMWSETGQLICNTPTMIVEGFLLLVLFQAHNLGNVRRRERLGWVLERRVRIVGFLGSGDGKCPNAGTSGVSLDSEIEIVEMKS